MTEGSQHNQCDWYDRQLKAIVGATVVEAGFEAGFLDREDLDEAKTPFLVLSLNGGEVTLIALADSEGNGPGWIELQS